MGLILVGWESGMSVDHCFARAWDNQIMIGSRRTWWRVADRIDQTRRPVVYRRTMKRQPRNKPVVVATGPGQVWSWDITDLYSPWVSITFKAYVITDIFSRQIVGWRVETREADHLAADMFEKAIALFGKPMIVHSDSGPSMTSNLVRNTLAAHGITVSYNRPYVSNDNPFSESAFRTMKYRPGYPRVFTSVEEARDYVAAYVIWYNTEHRHSGIALFTPEQVHDGTWTHTWATRDQALQSYYEQHPERFHTRPTTPTPADLVGINLPTKENQQNQTQLTPISLTWRVSGDQRRLGLGLVVKSAVFYV
jgi:transposase InsO family protein